MSPVSRLGLICLELLVDLVQDIADYIYKKASLDLSLQGIWIADRAWSPPNPPAYIQHSFPLAVIGWGVVQDQIPAVDFVHKYEHVFAFK
jgi:carboxypeptidase D